MWCHRVGVMKDSTLKRTKRDNYFMVSEGKKKEQEEKKGGPTVIGPHESHF